jgi:hypothetical protein
VGVRMQTKLKNVNQFLSLLLIGFFLLFLVPIFIDYEGFALPKSFYQFNTIFLSILIEAIPFVLIGVLIAGFIQMFITEDHIRTFIPKNKILAIWMGCIIGSLFPACECGIVPIVRRLIEKGVPLYAGVAFLLTGPLINPIVILSTYMAFGNDLEMALLRMGVGFVAALLIAFIVSILYPSNQLKRVNKKKTIILKKRRPIGTRIMDMFKHSIDEFFDMSKYLIIGAMVAALFRTFVSIQSLFPFGDGLLHSTVVMMVLAYVLSLCSEADAFIAASFKTMVPSTSILAFLVYGPMIDLKNTFMLLSVFKFKFVVGLFILITSIVFTFVTLTNFL